MYMLHKFNACEKTDLDGVIFLYICIIFFELDFHWIANISRGFLSSLMILNNQYDTIEGHDSKNNYYKLLSKNTNLDAPMNQSLNIKYNNKAEKESIQSCKALPG